MSQASAGFVAASAQCLALGFLSSVRFEIELNYIYDLESSTKILRTLLGFHEVAGAITGRIVQGGSFVANADTHKHT